METETTLKRFFVEGSGPLQPANIEMDPIYVPAAQVASAVTRCSGSTAAAWGVSELACDTPPPPLPAIMSHAAL